jgi:hypothetical protein
MYKKIHPHSYEEICFNEGRTTVAHNGLIKSRSMVRYNKYFYYTTRGISIEISKIHDDTIM